jgi:hypothetical protein
MRTAIDIVHLTVTSLEVTEYVTNPILAASDAGDELDALVWLIYKSIKISGAPRNVSKRAKRENTGEYRPCTDGTV